jgi:hypothetical protein
VPQRRIVKESPRVMTNTVAGQVGIRTNMRGNKYSKLELSSRSGVFDLNCKRNSGI